MQQGSSPDLGKTSSLRGHDLGILPEGRSHCKSNKKQLAEGSSVPSLSRSSTSIATVFKAHRVARFDPQPFRVLLSRRLRLPMPLSSRSCRCGRLLDSLGHHRAGCAEAGVLGRRGFALECSAAQLCREAGGRVSTNVMMRDLDIPGPHAAMDGRRLEVIADGLPLFDGAQLALDTTMVSPLHRERDREAGDCRSEAAQCSKRPSETQGENVP